MCAPTPLATEGARYANTGAPLGTGSSPIRRSARASIQPATEPASATSGLTTCAIRCVTRLLDLEVPIEQVNYLASHKSMPMTKRYDHANEERYGGAIEALDEAGKTGKAEALAAARGKQTE